MKVHHTTNHDETRKPVTAPGLAIFIRRDEAKVLYDQMTSLKQALTGDTPFVELHKRLQEALGDT